MGLTSDHIPVEEMLRSSALWLEKLPKASNANEEMMIFASYLINILAKNADPMDGNKIAKYNNYTNKRLCYGEDGQGEEWPQAPDISDRNLLAQAHHRDFHGFPMVWRFQFSRRVFQAKRAGPNDARSLGAREKRLAHSARRVLSEPAMRRNVQRIWCCHVMGTLCPHKSILSIIYHAHYDEVRASHT